MRTPRSSVWFDGRGLGLCEAYHEASCDLHRGVSNSSDLWVF